MKGGRRLCVSASDRTPESFLFIITMKLNFFVLYRGMLCNTLRAGTEAFYWMGNVTKLIYTLSVSFMQITCRIIPLTNTADPRV